jgi:IS5 family transposase
LGKADSVLERLSRRDALVTWGSTRRISKPCYAQGKEEETMLIDRYQVEDVFARVPELAAQIDPVLHGLDGLLEDDQLYQRVRADFGKRYRYTLVHGRHSTPVEVILRMLICKHLYSWSYRETEERVGDSLVLRWLGLRVFPECAHRNGALALAAHAASRDAARIE